VETLIVSVAALGLAVAFSSIGSLIAVLILLELPGGVRRSIAFVGGWVIMIAILTLALEVFPSLDYRNPRSTPTRLTSGVEILIGLGLIAWAIVLYRRPRPVTPKDPVPERLRRLMSRSPALSAAAGAVMLTYSLTVIAALEVLKAHVGKLDRAFAMLVYAATSVLVLCIPIVYAAVAPERSATTLASGKRWLTLNWQAISAFLLALIGAAIICKAGVDLAS
jgi:hypothetical protein